MFRVHASACALYLKFVFMKFTKLLPVHVSVNWRHFDDMLLRAECPLINRAEYCERCDGYFPVCPRPDMRPKYHADLIGKYVREYMSCVSIENQPLAQRAPEAKTK